MLLTISDVNELSASSTVGLWRSDADVFNGDELPEKANNKNSTQVSQGILLALKASNVPISPLELDSVKLGVPSV